MVGLSEVADLGELSSTLAVLSAMITPAILILGSGSLILTTSNRLTRVIDRVRDLAGEVEALADGSEDKAAAQERQGLLFTLLKRATRRATLLQRAMTQLYLALSTFVATSIAIGFVALTRLDLGVIALVFGFFGGGLMLAASVILIIESRIALGSVQMEMDFLWRKGKELAPGTRMEEQRRRVAGRRED